MKTGSSAAMMSRFFLPIALRTRSASTGRVSGELLQHQDDLLLVDEDPVGLLRDVLESRVQVDRSSMGSFLRSM